ncbi:hypothetical protein [Acidithiobacillus sp.]|uniref:hypothetical protein n=1 Tax=Acidithiobacillus sp. TaxID=1872118 RepID=UPI00261A9BFE|nr:hypothetical protein [Acidithiobacillus sp.]MDD5279523.1 hypothetical protein [Acidithiobacillus sp.]
MNIITAAEILNVRHDADYLVVRSVFLASYVQAPDQNHVDRLAAAHDYFMAHDKDARVAEYNALKPSPPKPLPITPVVTRCPNPASSNALKPVLTFQRRFFLWKRRQIAPVRWLIAIFNFLAVMFGRLMVVAALFYLNCLAVAGLVHWSISVAAWFGIVVIMLMLLFSIAILKLDWMLAGSMMIGGWKCVAESLELDWRQGEASPTKTTRYL